MKNKKSKFLRIFLPIIIIVLGLTGVAFGAANIAGRVIDGMSAEKGAYFDDAAAIAKKDKDVLRIGSFKNASNGYYEETTRRFSGIDTVATVDLPENAFLNLKLEIRSGDFKVVLTDADGNIHIVGGNVEFSAQTNADELTALPLAAGKYKVKLVGRDADFSIKMEFIF
jgi:hypothetical protein